MSAIHSSDDNQSTTVSSVEKMEPPTAGESADVDDEERDDNVDCTVSLEDVVAEEEALEADARAVLGAADGENCSYPKGYMTRQALYACGSCCPEGLAGVCLACSLRCHDGHDLFELYTKRLFRCDCGNSKFPSSNPCKLERGKDAVNAKNKYNHNFQGRYCTCDRPYPDPDDSVADEQIQCIVCEDWFHSRHLTKNKDSPPPSSDNYAEMVCRDCVTNLPFLKQLANIDAQRDGEEEEAGPCLKNMDSKPSPSSHSALFLSDTWRDKLCSCNECLVHYKEHGWEFLLDPKDTVHHYESDRGKKSGEGSLLEAGMDALGKMDRANQVEMLHEYNTMKSELTDYLKKFADDGKVVKEENIKEFFQGLKAQKRPRLELPENCR